MPSPTFADILAPMTPETFFAEYHDRKPLHIKGSPDKFAEVMSWRHLNDILNMTGIWSSQSLQMVLDCVPVPPQQYCNEGQDRDHRPILQPDAEKVTTLLRKGASVVCNDIDSLAPGLAAVSNALEDALMGKAQANLYCSWEQHKAFPSHYDTHDVYAVHVEGTKTWNVYEGRAEQPIAHPMFKTLTQAHHDRAKGKLLMEAVLEPGDLLYLPRGQYHDALAASEATIHVAFGLHHPLGMDFLNMMFERAVHDPLFRTKIPRLNQEDGEARLRAHMEALGRRFAELATDPGVLEAFKGFLEGYRFPRGGFALPDLGAGKSYKVRAQGLKLVRRGQDFAIKLPNGLVPIPAGGQDIVGWVFARSRFTEAEIDAAFAGVPADKRAMILAGLTEMKLIEAT